MNQSQNHQVEQLVQDWLQLSEEQQQDFLRRTQQKAAPRKSQSRMDTFDLGPINQSHCPYCGR